MEAPPQAPDAQSLKEAAAAHLARFAATERGLRQVLTRRVRRWAQRAVRAGLPEEEAGAAEAALRPVIEQIVAEMIRLGAVNDGVFSRSRARSLTRTGHSRRLVEAHLLMKGVDRSVAQDALEEALGVPSEEAADRAEMVAALILARRRSLGPFRRADRPEGELPKILGIFARNGFSLDIARTVLDMEREEAEDQILRFKSRF